VWKWCTEDVGKWFNEHWGKVMDWRLSKSDAINTFGK
jgi:hypothetical protein